MRCIECGGTFFRDMGAGIYICKACGHQQKDPYSKYPDRLLSFEDDEEDKEDDYDGPEL